MGSHHSEPWAVHRVRALESLLIEKGLLSTEVVDAVVQTYEKDVGPMNGAKVVARAWVDPGYKQRLLENETAAIAEPGSGALAMRNIVNRPDGRRIHVARMLGQLFVCADGCCCGLVQDGYAPVPRELYHAEWDRRRLRNRVHLTIGGCLGPCALANVVMLLFEGRQAWFHSMSSDGQVLALYDWIEDLVRAKAWSPPPRALAAYQFTASTWEARPDGRPVDDLHLRPGAPLPRACRVPPPAPASGAEPNRLVSNMEGVIAVPRKNGELVFEAPWEGRVFGMAVALYDRRLYGWEEFQRSLIDETAKAGNGAAATRYYERWLACFERLLVKKGVVESDELDDRTEAFGSGERDEVY